MTQPHHQHLARIASGTQTISFISRSYAQKLPIVIVTNYAIDNISQSELTAEINLHTRSQATE